jgi:hypothetical protein
MTFAGGWVCRSCWLSNRPRDEVCYRCKTPRHADDAEIEARRKAAEEKAAQPEVVPDIVVALPAVIFRVYSRVWMRGGIGVGGLLALLLLAGVTDVTWLLLTLGFAIGLVVFGFVAGEVSDGMRDREPWAFVAGMIMAVVAAIGSVLAFSVFAPGLVNPTAIRWASAIVFGGAALAAGAGLVLLFINRERES